MENICRICLEGSRRLLSLFTCQDIVSLQEFIKDFCNVTILQNDGYTDKICRMCLEKLRTAQEIKVKCQESDRRLRQLNLENLKPVSSPPIIKFEEFDSFINKMANASNDPTPVLDLSSSHNIDESKHIENFDELNETCDVLSNFKKELHEQDSDSSGNLDDAPAADKAKRRRSRVSDKTHMCSICGKTFYTSGHLRSHELIHNDSKDFTCHLCSKKFLKKSYLNRHMKSHLNERNYKCKACGKGFNTSTTLGYHFRLVHSGATTFQCSYCNKAFPLKIQLVSHTRSHTGEKPHKCDQCDKKYSHKIDLKRHMMLHSGNKAYKCPYCDRTFTKKSNMECHIPTHTGEKPYKCNICLKEFRQPCPYKKHMQTHAESAERDANNSSSIMFQNNILDLIS